MKKFSISINKIIILLFLTIKPLHSAEMNDPIKVDWSFKGLTGTFDRASLQRGFQVYKEVCSSCHSMQYLSYRNLGESGPSSISKLAAIAFTSCSENSGPPGSPRFL